MARKKKESQTEEIVKLEKIENKKVNNISEGFYYLLGLVISLVLIFATEELLSTINYLFVVIFAIIAIIQIIVFVVKKDYMSKNYASIIAGIVSLWLAMFILKYGDFLFLEMFPVLASFMLCMMAISSLTKYFDYKKNGNLIVFIISIALAVVLIFVPKSIMYTIFKLTGFYIILMISLDFVDYIKKGK